MGLWRTGKHNNHYIKKNNKPLTGLNIDVELKKTNSFKRHVHQSEGKLDIDAMEDDENQLTAMAKRGNIKAKGALFWQFSSYRTRGAIAEILNLNKNLQGYPVVDNDWGDISVSDRKKIIDYVEPLEISDFKIVKKSIIDNQKSGQHVRLNDGKYNESRVSNYQTHQDFLKESEKLNSIRKARGIETKDGVNALPAPDTHEIKIHRPNTKEGFELQMNKSIDDMESEEIRKYQNENKAN